MKSFFDLVKELKENNYEFFYETSAKTRSGKILVNTDSNSHVIEINYTSKQNGDLMFDHIRIYNRNFNDLTDTRIRLALNGFSSESHYVFGTHLASIKRQVAHMNSDEFVGITDQELKMNDNNITEESKAC